MRTESPIEDKHDRISEKFYAAKEEDMLNISKCLIEHNRQAYEELAK